VPAQAELMLLGATFSFSCSVESLVLFGGSLAHMDQRGRFAVSPRQLRDCHVRVSRLSGTGSGTRISGRTLHGELKIVFSTLYIL
jgi:hypothetical protein